MIEDRGPNTHRWDYRYPGSTWEKMPFWIRWPLAVVFAIYFGGGLLAGIIGLMRLG